MAATLIAVIAALALGHLAPALVAGLRRFGWFDAWLRWLDAQFPADSVWRGRFGIALALVVPLLVLGLFQLALAHPLWGLAGLLLDIAVLVYCWGPRDLDLDVAAVIDAPDPAARRAAAAHLWPPGEPPVLDGPALVEAVFRNAVRRWFGPLLWFLLLGPFGALLYRLAALAAERDANTLPPQTAAGARTLLAWLDWPAAQLATLSLALVGNFDSVMAAWREEGAFALDGAVLATAARASVRSEIAEEAADYTESGIPAATAIAEVFGELPELRDAMNMAWRILVLWLATIALFVVAGWVG
jgi:AmpE protein